MGSNDHDIEHLVAEIQDYQLSRGSILKRIPLLGGPATATARPVGVSICPTVFTREHFDEAIGLQRCFNELYVKASADVQYLEKIFRPLLAHDQFLATLWEILRKANQMTGHNRQSVTCGIFRSDYMVHAAGPEPGLRQVEMNTISVAGAVHAETTVNMHKHLSRTQYCCVGTGFLRSTQPLFTIDEGQVRHTDGMVTLPAEILPKYTVLGCTFQLQDRNSMLIHISRNFNIADERPIEYGLWGAGYPCYRCEWQDVIENTLQLSDGTLLYKPQTGGVEVEISVVYYRAGYEASEYDQLGQRTRLHLETSRAIQCPDILTHLTTFKAVQQALGEANAVERFLSTKQAHEVRSTFMPMHTLNSPRGHRIVDDKAEVLNYILKPNLEGGGNNVYGADIIHFLQSREKQEKGGHVLMQRIEPPTTNGFLLTSQGPYKGPVISEFGVLGTCLWRRVSVNEVEILSNNVAGWTFKTKPANVDEMSVVKGYGVFDCPRFITR